MTDNFSNKYEVGYKRPPKAHQFKPGQSGNKNGRPKKTNSLAMDLEEELSELIFTTENGKKKKITKQRALAKKIAFEALSGKASVLKLLISLLDTLPKDNLQKEDLSAEDKTIIEDYIRRFHHE